MTFGTQGFLGLLITNPSLKIKKIKIAGTIWRTKIQIFT